MVGKVQRRAQGQDRGAILPHSSALGEGVISPASGFAVISPKQWLLLSGNISFKFYSFLPFCIFNIFEYEQV